ncbi:hypothetical protein [Parvibaculum sedimenti]|uniref:hypothetical protein n=1 Tax=Parvibaculum sedimenti TaxID=2608632 RepID=UPI00163A80A7
MDLFPRSVGEDAVEVLDPLDLDRIAAGVAEEHGVLLTRFSRKTQDGRNIEMMPPDSSRGAMRREAIELLLEMTAPAI